VTRAAIPKIKRVFDARPDTLDFRDKMYVPQLIEVPTHIPLRDFQHYQVPVLDQGDDGACTGFGLATVANYLLARRKVEPDPTPVSPRMLYELARRYDEWPGENYSGSSARGAMKAWHKHGVCSEKAWPYVATRRSPPGLTQVRISDAIQRPLGAYFRVNHKDLVAMHSALAEVGVLYATGLVHDGWERVGPQGLIPYSKQNLGGHAFAIVAYDAQGFWIQNSWGTDWGLGGFACLTYDDWLENGTDIWVARLGAPVMLRTTQSAAQAHSAAAGESAAYSYADLRQHIVSLGNDGRLNPGGNYGTTPAELAQIFHEDIPRLTADWDRKRILLYAHGGLVGEESAVQRLADYRAALLEAHIYPLAFIWHSDYWTTISNILQDAIRRRRPEGALNQALDFMLDRLDDALEPIVRALTGKLVWDEMKENAEAASERAGGARRVLSHLAQLQKQDPQVEVHLAGHSAGGIFLAPLVRLLTAKGRIDSGYLKGEAGYGIKVASCTLWAPGCTLDLFKQAYLPAIESRMLERLAVFVLSDGAEQADNCAGIYNKSLLYLVSNALEATPRVPPAPDGVPLLGMAKFIQHDDQVRKLFQPGQDRCRLVVAPNDEPEGAANASHCQHHGDFDDDRRTVLATLANILGTTHVPASPAAMPLDFHHSGSSLRDRRQRIDGATRAVPRD